MRRVVVVLALFVAGAPSCTCRKVPEEVVPLTSASASTPPAPQAAASTSVTAIATPSASYSPPVVEEAAPCAETTHTLTAGEMAKARKLDLGTWRFEKDHVGAYSWSYVEPGLLVFGDVGDTATIRAKMQSAKPAAEGNQGIALCVRDDTKGAQRDELWFARYFAGQVQLLKHAQFNGSGEGNYGWYTVALGRMVTIEAGAPYTLQLCVKDGRRVSVWLDGKLSLAYGSAHALRGRPALVAANGTFEFRDVAWSISH
jgi:hypothetical protein